MIKKYQGKDPKKNQGIIRNKIKHITKAIFGAPPDVRIYLEKRLKFWQEKKDQLNERAGSTNDSPPSSSQHFWSFSNS